MTRDSPAEVWRWLSVQSGALELHVVSSRQKKKSINNICGGHGDGGWQWCGFAIKVTPFRCERGSWREGNVLSVFQHEADVFEITDFTTASEWERWAAVVTSETPFCGNTFSYARVASLQYMHVISDNVSHHNVCVCGWFVSYSDFNVSRQWRHDAAGNALPATTFLLTF